MRGLSADELSLISGSSSDLRGLYTNSLTAAISPTLWSNSYKLIYYANSAIEGLTASTTVSVDVKKQLIGEAKFMRAFLYFYLTNLYGDVPLIMSSDYKAKFDSD